MLKDIIWHIKLDNQILFILNMVIYDIDICKLILKIKKDIEKIETLQYYDILYTNIAIEHKYLHENHTCKFSYILDSTKYVIKPDFKLDYYNYRGVSYQIIELIHELIKLKNDKYTSANEGYKYWLDHDDKLYFLLSKKIKDIL